MLTSHLRVAVRYVESYRNDGLPPEGVAPLLVALHAALADAEQMSDLLRAQPIPADAAPRATVLRFPVLLRPVSPGGGDAA